MDQDTAQGLINKIDELSWGFGPTQLNRALRAGGYAELDIVSISNAYQNILLLAKEVQEESK